MTVTRIKIIQNFKLTLAKQEPSTHDETYNDGYYVLEKVTIMANNLELEPTLIWKGLLDCDRETLSIAFNLEYDTGVMLDGYRWFEVSYDNDNGEPTTGFVWGGILCSNEPDVYGQCPSEWANMEQEIASKYSDN